MIIFGFPLAEFINIFANVLTPLVVGLAIWLLGENALNKRIKSEAIRELMTYRGAFSSQVFRRALNKISVTFHNDDSVRKEVRELYEAMNNPANQEAVINRKIVGLIYNLCQKNGFQGLTEYDIDQAFPESKQSPDPITESITEPIYRHKENIKKVPKQKRKLQSIK